jgi:hypothetical protein
MKKTILLLLALLSFASAEILLKEISLDKIEKHYIRLDTAGSFGKIVFAYVDYGQNGHDRDQVVINKTGGKREFTSEIEILNIFYENGWEIKASITEPTGGSDGGFVSGDTYYILEKMDEK